MQKENRRRNNSPMARMRGEKPKDFKGTWKKLLKYCKSHLVVLIIAIICSIAGTLLTLVGPDKLADFTNVVTDSLVPDTAAMESLMKEISDSTGSELQEIIQSIAAKVTLQDYSDLEINGSKISIEDQMATMDIASKLASASEEEAQALMAAMPASVTAACYKDITVNGVLISAADQKEAITLFMSSNSEDPSEMLKNIDKLPESIYNLIVKKTDMDKILEIGLFLVGMYALSYVLSSTQSWIMGTVTQKISFKLRNDISEKINKLPMSFYNRRSVGDTLSIVTNDVDTIGQSLNQSVGTLVSAVVLFIGSLFMMLITNVVMTLSAVAASLIGFSFIFIIMGKSQKYFGAQQRSLGKINGQIEEIYTGHNVVKAYNGEEKEEETFRKLNSELRTNGFKAACLSSTMMPLMGFIGNLGYVVVCVVGGAMAINGNISFGVIVSFMMYIRYFTQPLNQIAQSIQSLQSAAAAGERVFEFLEAKEMENEDDKDMLPENIEGQVEFRNVKFGYEDTDRIIIKNFSAVAKPGQKIAIVGPTGAGKTTIVNLLMRFHEINDGEILIDNVPTKGVSRESVHSKFCMVLQDTWLFEGTVRENLVYSTENVSDETIVKACKAVGLHHFVKTLPNGYDTVLNDMVNMSEGQKQQLTIARAMIADKPMLILDEATSSVDTRTELKIQEAMDKLMEGRTSFIIAHRLSTIKNADLILVLKDGDVIESGNHNELLDKKGFYYELYNSQFEK